MTHKKVKEGTQESISLWRSVCARQNGRV